jgi:hypothetical protein
MARRLKASVVVNGEVYVAGSEPPAKVAEQITNPNAWEGDTPREADSSYNAQKVAELREEIDRRNVDRDPDGDMYITVAADAKKTELVAALEADDAR